MESGDKESKVEKAVTILERDAFRCDGAVGYDRILALAQKLELSADDLVALRRRLIELEIAIENDPLQTEPAATVGEASEDAEPGKLGSKPPEEDPAYQNAIEAYLAEASGIDLLKPAEEVELMRRIRAGELATARLVEGHGDPDGVLVGIKRDGEKARHAFIEANLRLVVAMAKTTPRGQMALEDLIQEGNFGLLKAVEMFDHTRGLRFSTYATWWIWSKMQRAVCDRGYLVRVPVHLRERYNKLRRLEAALTKERKGTAPTDLDVAQHLGWTPEAVQFLRDLDLPPLSLDRNVHEDSRDSLGDSLSSPLAVGPEQETGDRELLAAIVAAIDGLGDREKRVMRMRFGLADGEAHTLEEIGEEMGVTRERARQIQNEALERIRHPARSKAIAELIKAGLENDRGRASGDEPKKDGDDE